MWTPAVLEFEYDPGYELEFEVEAQDETGTPGGRHLRGGQQPLPGPNLAFPKKIEIGG
jgi:hypothetical protein